MTSNYTLTVSQLDALTTMLDPESGLSKMAMQRPSTQSVGYSLAEAPTHSTHIEGSGDVQGSASGAPDSNTSDGNNSSSTKIAATPGGVYVPPETMAKKVHESLPVPSKTKEGKKEKSEQSGDGSKAPKPTGNDIWAKEEIATNIRAPQNDRREEPEYELVYKQHVGAEDVYLGVDFTRDGSVHSCEGMALRVKMPKETSAREMELDVQPLTVTLRSQIYRLHVDLPMRVYEDKGSAKWDAKKKVLEVALTLDHTGKEVKVM